MMVFEFILTCLMGLLFALSIIYLVGYTCSSGTVCKIKFSDFLKWYAVDPNMWVVDTENNYVCKRDVKTYHDIGCRFGYIDFIRYHHWARRQRRHQARCDAYHSTEALLRSVQADIDRVREQSQRELSEAESVTRRVMENPHPDSPVEDFLKVWRNIKIH